MLDWTVALPNSAEGVRIPKPLQQLLKPDHFRDQALAGWGPAVGNA